MAVEEGIKLYIHGIMGMGGCQQERTNWAEGISH